MESPLSVGLSDECQIDFCADLSTFGIGDFHPNDVRQYYLKLWHFGVCVLCGRTPWFNGLFDNSKRGAMGQILLTRTLISETSNYHFIIPAKYIISSYE